ncbi:unnamed protein product, partial [Allacma fusca]
MKQLLQLFFVGLALGAWQDGVDIKSHLRQDELRIVGSFTGHPEDHLSLLRWTPENLFVGAKDSLVNLSARDLHLNSVLNWTVSSHHRDQCQIKGQPDSKCYNFLRVLHGPLPLPQLSTKDEGSPENVTKAGTESKEGYIVCGTNAFKPTCRYYDADLKNHTTEVSGVGYSPFDPTHSSTSVFHGGSVYAGTVADFGGTDALIYKNPLRTEQNDLKHLNSPAFVSSISLGDFALFFFREFAIEHSNCGKAVFSRVARLCRHDRGSRKHKDRFTTFLKARLNCSVPGEFPFYFDHIRGTTDIFTNTNLGTEMLYAVFTTAPNSIGGSAVCAFSVDSIRRAFEGPFKGQASYNSNWLPVPSKEVPDDLGRCTNDPDNVPNSNSVAFLKAHPLMDEAVQGTLKVTRTTHADRFTAVEVDHSANVQPYHIVYIGTDSGKVFKSVVNASMEATDADFSPDQSVISQSWDVFPKKPIKSLRLVSPKRLLVTTETDMVIIRVDNCKQFLRCTQCLEIRDPHCAWDLDHGLCVPKDPEVSDKELPIRLIQDVTQGDINLCPVDVRVPEVPVEANHLKSIIEPEDLSVKLQQSEECCSCGTTTLSSTGQERSLNKDKDLGDLNLFGVNSSNDQTFAATLNDSLLDNEITNFQQDFKSSFVKSEDGTVSSHSVVLATTTSAILSLLVGFALGFIAAKWLSTRQNKTKDSSTNAQLAANEAQRLTTKPIDFVVNVPTANKNPLKNNLNSETLEKTVKKIERLVCFVVFQQYLFEVLLKKCYLAVNNRT